jgi:hypothetical protein
MLEFQRLRLLKTLEHPTPANPAAPAPPFSRRRHDDALTPNSTPHDGIPIRREPIINNQSSIVSIESTPEPRQNHPTSTIQTCPPKAESSIIAQNKPNSPNDKTTATSYATQIYSNIPLRSAPKKQTQTKPIPPTQYAIPNTQYEKQTQSNPISNDQSQFQTQKQLTPLAGREITTSSFSAIDNSPHIY